MTSASRPPLAVACDRSGPATCGAVGPGAIREVATPVVSVVRLEAAGTAHHAIGFALIGAGTVLLVRGPLGRAPHGRDRPRPSRRWAGMTLEMFFGSWSALGRVVIVGALAYLGLVAFLRISGKRTLAKLNAFDLVVTVALGSTLSTLVTSETVSLARGLTAFALLIGLQYAVAWSSVRSGAVARLARSEPTLLMRDGEVLTGALARERVTRAELLTVIRQSPQSKPGRVSAVILESDGSFSVIGKDADDPVPFAAAGLEGQIERADATRR